MKQTINTYQIAEALIQDDNAAWSRSGAFALAEYLEQYEEDCETEMELDVVAIRCDFSEHASAVDCIDDMGYDCSCYVDMCAETEQDEREEAALEYLRENTQVVEFAGGIIIQGF